MTGPQEVVLCYNMPLYVHVDLEDKKVTRVVYSLSGMDSDPYNALDFRGVNATSDELPLDDRSVKAAVAIADQQAETDYWPFPESDT